MRLLLLLPLALFARPVLAQPSGDNSAEQRIGGLRDHPLQGAAADVAFSDADSDGLDTDSDGLGVRSACSGFSGSADMYVRVLERGCCCLLLRVFTHTLACFVLLCCGCLRACVEER